MTGCPPQSHCSNLVCGTKEGRLPIEIEQIGDRLLQDSWVGYGGAGAMG